MVCMFGYITELDHVDVDPTTATYIEVEGHDRESLFYNFLDEFLFQFCTEGFVCKAVEFTYFDADKNRIKAVGYVLHRPSF